MSYKVQTKNYSGPFDLLLQLVSRQKLSIGSISIADVADQYLEEVEAMTDLDLDVASDFVLVASTLLDIKAASLVPAYDQKQEAQLDEDEDLEDLSPEEAREVLIARLIAYKQFRSVAANLAARMEQESKMIARSAGPDPEFLNLMPDYLEGITLRSLAVICADLDSRRESFLLEAEHVAPKRLPIALKVAAVDRIVRSKGATSFSDLLEHNFKVENIVATFLALLELVKRGSLILRQAETFGEIEIAHLDDAESVSLEDIEFSSFEGE